MTTKDKLYFAIMRLFLDNDIKSKADMDEFTKDCSDLPDDIMLTAMDILEEDLRNNDS